MAAISVIIVSELGDKTFFIAAIMAMRYNRLTVLAGAMLALGLMTCLSGECSFLLMRLLHLRESIVAPGPPSVAQHAGARWPGVTGSFSYVGIWFMFQNLGNRKCFQYINSKKPYCTFKIKLLAIHNQDTCSSFFFLKILFPFSPLQSIK